MASKCCNDDCPCPNAEQNIPGHGPYQRGYGGLCCGCTLYDYDAKKSLCASNAPIDPICGSTAKPNFEAPCKCYCKKSELPDPCPTAEHPDLRAEGCCCVCQKAVDLQETGIDPCWTTADGVGSLKALRQPCTCKCVGSDAICKAANPGTPNYRQNSDTDCECYCKLAENNTCAQFTPSTPHVNPDDCSCYCNKRPYGTDPAQLVSPPRTACGKSAPFVNKKCECYCDKVSYGSTPGDGQTACPEAQPNVNPEDCSCYCDILPPHGPGCNYLSEPDFDDQKCKCYCKEEKDGCQGGKIPDPHGCGCICPEDECDGKCVDDCPEGQDRQADCSCYDPDAGTGLSQQLIP